MLALISVTERCTEVPHGRGKLKTIFKHSGPLDYSIALKSVDLGPFYNSKEAFLELAKLCDLTKHTKQVPRLLGVHKHPWLEAMPKSSHSALAVMT